MSEQSAHAPESWRRFHEERAAANFPKWPNEAMVKVLFGRYLAEPVRPQADWRVLDVGCGFGNNLAPFLDLGCDCHGVEIDPGIAPVTSRVLEQRGYRATIGTGTNRSIPYPDAHFDLLLSINTLHYEGREDNILAALREFQRVLKPGGIVYVSTVGPEHDIQRRAQALGEHRYRIRNYDFRDGEEFFFFESTGYLETCLARAFGRVETGRVTEKLMTAGLDFLIALGRK